MAAINIYALDILCVKRGVFHRLSAFTDESFIAGAKYALEENIWSLEEKFPEPPAFIFGEG